MANFLILGGAGHYSHQLVRELSNQGHQTIVLDNLSTGQNSHIQWGPLIKAQVRDAHRIERAIKEYSLSHIINTVTDFKSPLSSLEQAKETCEDLFCAMKLAEQNPQTLWLWWINKQSPALNLIQDLLKDSPQNLKAIYVEDFKNTHFSPNRLNELCGLS